MKTKNINYIYVLSEPTGEIRYVGKSVNPKDRYRRHLNEAKKRNSITYKSNWIYSLLKKGLKPKIEVIDQVDGEWEWLEQYWISQMKIWGFDLVNDTEGGENPPTWKDGQVHNNEFIKHLSDRMKKDNPSKNSFGLGLYLVDSILKAHNKVLAHEYENGMNRFIFA